MHLSSRPSFNQLLVLYAMALGPTWALNGQETRAHEARGAIKSVDPAAQTLIITERRDGSERKFLWNDRTQFREHGKAVTFADIKGGERVRITYSDVGAIPTMDRVLISRSWTDRP